MNPALPDTGEKIHSRAMCLKLSIGVGKRKFNKNSLNNQAPRLCSKRHSSILFINFVSIQLGKASHKTILTPKSQKGYQQYPVNMRRFKNVRNFPRLYR